MFLMVCQVRSHIPFISWCLGAAKDTLMLCSVQSWINSRDVKADPASAWICERSLEISKSGCGL